MLLGRLEELMAEKNILSLDVFDTLLLRDNYSELTRFIEIGERMAKCAGTSNQIPLPPGCRLENQGELSGREND